MEKVIRLLEESYKELQGHGEEVVLERIRGSVDVMKGKLELLRDENDNTPKERAKKRFWW